MNLPLYTLSESESDENDVKDYDPVFDDIQLPSLNTERKKSKTSTRALKTKGDKRKKEEKSKISDKKPRKEDEKKSEPTTKSIKPGDCMQYVSVVIDTQLLTQKFGGELLTALQSSEVKYNVQEQKIPNTISWISKAPESGEESEAKVVMLWTWDEFLGLIANDMLMFRIKECTKSIADRKFTLIIIGIEEYFRMKKTFKNRELKANVTNAQTCDKPKPNKKENVVLNAPTLSRIELEMVLVELQVSLDVQCKFVETGQELALFITQITKAMAELPHKLERNKRLECTEWFAEADSKESVRVDNSGNGLLRLWQQQLCQFPNVGLDVAQSIASNYHSPQALLEAYSKCSSRKEGELLLQNIPIRRVHGPLTSVRKVGPELSKKVYAFFNSKDGNALLSTSES